MGCLNSTGSFSHWFGNIHLSGPCNRSCYFCIGQHMMALDALNTLHAWPLPGIDEFLARCRARGVRQVFLTGTNTDPLLYDHAWALRGAVLRALPGATLGVRTNGVAWHLPRVRAFDHGSITICSLNPRVYREMMGRGDPPNVVAILDQARSAGWIDLKINIVLGPENAGDDLIATLDGLADAGARRVNLREPYGQPRVGDPLAAGEFPSIGKDHGMPAYAWRGMRVTYWDVHYCEVESVNLYASGRVSEDYPITRGHDDGGVVQDQTHFPGGRVRQQWVRLPVVHQ